MEKAPTNQASRRVGFLLQKNGQTVGDFVELVLRPEDLSRRQASRLVVSQTLGGAWVDSHGEGLAQISISGHTGWRFDATQKDGLDRFRTLRDVVFKDWHRLRSEESKAGKDPDRIQLIFIDELDDICAFVAPVSFELRRSKTQPLLQRYAIQLTELEPVKNPLGESQKGTGVFMQESLAATVTEELDMITGFAAIETLKANAERLATAAAAIEKADNGLLFQIGRVGKKVADSLTAATEYIQGLNQQGIPEVEALLMEITRFVFASRNLVLAVAGQDVGSEVLKGQFRGIAQNFSELFCNLINLRPNFKSIFDFSQLHGTSNCSSTRGGEPASPYADVNAFEAIFSSQAPPLLNNTPDTVAVLGRPIDPLEWCQLPTTTLETALENLANAIQPIRLPSSTIDPALDAALNEAPLVVAQPTLRRATVRVGESIQQFAFRETGSANQWPAIVALNKLLPPYLDGRGGQTLLVPSDSRQSGNNIQPDDDSVYLKDLQLVDGALTGIHGDLRTVRGYKNLVQALRIRLSTPNNTLIYHAEYGNRIHSLLGDSNSGVLITLAKNFTESALRSDPRIDSVKNLLVNVQGDSLQVKADAVAKDAALVPFST
jgi:phage baseplate assembly protein W